MSNELKKLKQENKHNTEQLKEQNVETLSHLMGALSVARVGEVQREFLRKDLIGMAKEAELRGETLAATLGEDAEDWCTSVIAAGTPAPWWEGIVEVLYYMLQMLLLVLLVEWACSPQAFRMGNMIFWLVWGCGVGCYRCYIYPRFAAAKGTRATRGVGIAVVLFALFAAFDLWLDQRSIPVLQPAPWVLISIVFVLLCALWGVRRVHQMREYRAIVAAQYET